MIESKENIWYTFIQQNMHLFSEDAKFYANKFNITESRILRTTSPLDIIENDIDDYEWLWIDGWSSEAHWHIVNDLTDKPFVPMHINENSKLYFYNETEGYCTDYIFDMIHWVIDKHNLKASNVVYRNLAMNNYEIYDLYCKRKNITEKIRFNSCLFFNNSQVKCYDKPVFYGKIVPLKQKKFYLNLNWNAWQHRLLAIAGFHYYDLIDEGYVSSPCANKFAYDKDKDWQVLVDRVNQYIGDNPSESNSNILGKLDTLKIKYPLMIDDRSKYANTDVAFVDTVNKIPVFTARQNSLFEVVSETHTYGPCVFHEKTFWPIMEIKPFFQINSVNSLKFLRQLGYKTFSPYIDESYDDEPNLMERIKKVAIELVRLNKMRLENPTEFYSMYDKLIEIAEYNHTLFYNTKYV